MHRDSPLLQVVECLQSPAPFYDANADELKCFASLTYGDEKWALPPASLNMKYVYRTGLAYGAGGAATASSLTKKMVQAVKTVGMRVEDAPYR